MRDKTVKLRGNRGRVVFFSPSKGTTWGGLFGIQLRSTRFSDNALLSSADARDLARELVRRAEDIETREER